MRWLYLWFPALCVQHLLQHEAQDKAEPPFALLPPDTRSSHLLQCNAVASRYGVCADMPLSTALCLCPQLIVRRLDESQQQALLHSRALWAGQFSAHVSIDEPEGLWLEAASMLQLFNGAAGLRQNIMAAANTEGWPVRLGAGDTPYAARLRAYAGLSASQGHDDLKSLSLHALQHGRLFSEASLSDLQRLGMRSLADILRLPLSGLSTRLGDDLSRAIRRLLGYEPHPLAAFQPAETFCQQVPFISEVEHANGLLFPLQRLLRRLTDFLNRRQLSSRCLNLITGHRQMPDTHWAVGFAHAEHRYDELLFICRHYLDRQRLSAPALSLTLSVSEFHARTTRQPGLLQQKEGYRRDDAHYLLNRLSTRLQAEQLQQLQALPDPRPEFAAAFIAGDSPYQRPAAQLRSDLSARPLWLLPEPVPCPPPDAVLHGPERLCGGWWQAPDIRRDYYQVQYGDQRLWLFHCADGWFVHGIFS